MENTTLLDSYLAEFRELREAAVGPADALIGHRVSGAGSHQRRTQGKSRPCLRHRQWRPSRSI
jgi:hypothetical protein